MESVKDKVYVVTGASKGFGLAIAKALVAEGAKVGMIARGKSLLDQVVADIGEQAFAVAAAVHDKPAIDAGIKAVADHFGRLDGLVNNAGLARPGTVENMPADDIALQLNTNIAGLIYCCQAAIPLFAKDNPRIVNISSASAVHFDEMAHLSVYAASKAAVERLSRDLRTELQDQGIGVTVIRPGGCMTEFASSWDIDRLSAGLKAWLNYGPTMDTGMLEEHVAEAVRWSLCQPPGVASDLLEIRPNRKTEKIVL